MERVSQEHLDQILKTQDTVKRLWANANKKQGTNIELSDAQLSYFVKSHLQRKIDKPDSVDTFNSLVSDIESSLQNNRHKEKVRVYPLSIRETLIVERSEIRSKLLGEVETTIQTIPNTVVAKLTSSERDELQTMTERGIPEMEALKSILPPEYYQTIKAKLDTKKQRDIARLRS